MIYINLNLKTCFRCKQEIANINIEKQRIMNDLPDNSGNFCNSRFFDILNLELLCRLSFLITGPPGWYLILLMSVGGGGALPTGGPPVILFACER